MLKKPKKLNKPARTEEVLSDPKPKDNQDNTVEEPSPKYSIIIWVLTGLGCLIIASVCFFIYRVFTQQINQKSFANLLETNSQMQNIAGSNPETAINSTEEQPLPLILPTDRVPTLAERVGVSCSKLDSRFPCFNNSTVLQPVAKKLYQHFAGKELPTDFEFLTTPLAYEALFNGDLNFVIATNPSAEEQTSALAKGLDLKLTPVISDAFVFLVAASNPVSSLTQQQIRDIYSGKITNWNQVGGNDAPIQAFQRNKGSGSQTGMVELVMKGTPLITPQLHQIQAVMGGLMDSVSLYNGEANGIGYSYKYYADTIYQEIDKNVADGVKILSVDGFAPTTANIQAKTYPFTTAYYFVYDNNTVADQTIQILNFLQNDDGKTMIEDLQYVPYN